MLFRSVKAKLVATDEALLKVTVWTKGVPSVCVSAVTVLMVGALSLSVIVAVPNAEVLLVVPAVLVAVKVKSSVGSLILSFTISVRTNIAAVLPGGMVALVATIHVVPLSVEISSVGLKSLPLLAVPLASIKLKLVAVALALDSETPNTA